MTCGVYLLTTPRGERYVGSSQDVEQRYRDHRKEALGGYHINRFLQAAFVEHRELTFTVLDECRPEERISREQHYLDTLLPEMNLARIAGRVDFTPEVREKIARGWTEERKARTRAAMLGNTRCVGRTDGHDTRQKRSQALKGRTFTNEARAKMSASQKARMAKRKEDGYGRFNPR